MHLLYEVVLDDKFNVDDFIKYDDFDILVEHKYFQPIDEATPDYEGPASFSSHFDIINNPMKSLDVVVGRVFGMIFTENAATRVKELVKEQMKVLILLYEYL